MKQNFSPGSQLGLRPGSGQLGLDAQQAWSSGQRSASQQCGGNAEGKGGFEQHVPF